VSFKAFAKATTHCIGEFVRVLETNLRLGWMYIDVDVAWWDCDGEHDSWVPAFRHKPAVGFA
jgi:hypothetical protein